MAISTDFNYDDLLSLERAKLVGRERQNFLGTKELVLDYHLQTSGAKEDCVEWLSTNRLSLTDPEFSFKTYEGVWTCISISYNEDAKVIRQTFKIDSSIGDLGDGVDFGSQSGDQSRISIGMEMERAYYWRISDPESIELPSSPIVGEIWTKTANDNGDGTYDVTVQKEVAQNLTAYSAVQAGGNTSANTDIVVTNAETVACNGTYTLGGTSQGMDYWYNGSFYINWNVTDGGTWFFSEVLLAVNWHYKASVGATTSPPLSGYTASALATGGLTSIPPLLVIGGGSGGPYAEESEVNTNTDEVKFVADSGTEADAVDGKVKTITNTPLENGLFRVAITTRDAQSLRTPTAEGSFLTYSSDFLVSAKGVIKGRNRTYSQFTTDIQLLGFSPYITRINNVSFNINEFGLYDYTITSDVPG